MSTVAKDTVEDALSGIVDPHTGLDLVTGKSVNDCVVDGETFRLTWFWVIPLRDGTRISSRR